MAGTFARQLTIGFSTPNGPQPLAAGSAKPVASFPDRAHLQRSRRQHRVGRYHRRVRRETKIHRRRRGTQVAVVTEEHVVDLHPHRDAQIHVGDDSVEGRRRPLPPLRPLLRPGRRDCRTEDRFPGLHPERSTAWSRHRCVRRRAGEERWTHLHRSRPRRPMIMSPFPIGRLKPLLSKVPALNHNRHTGFCSSRTHCGARYRIVDRVLSRGHRRREREDRTCGTCNDGHARAETSVAVLVRFLH